MALRIIQGIYAVMLILLTAMASKYFTDIGLNNFYDLLNLPDLTPENNYFKIIWRGLYGLLFLSFYIILVSNKTVEEFDEANVLFIQTLFMQVLWTFSFFFMGQLIASSIVILLLIILSVLMGYTFFKINKWAGALLIPYLVWIIFAAFLNISIAIIN